MKFFMILYSHSNSWITYTNEYELFWKIHLILNEIFEDFWFKQTKLIQNQWKSISLSFNWDVRTDILKYIDQGFKIKSML
jgi:hypothetical protein